MAEETLPFKFRPGQRVSIREARGINGIIGACTLYLSGRSRYLVIWWHDGRRIEEWLEEAELE